MATAAAQKAKLEERANNETDSQYKQRTGLNRLVNPEDKDYGTKPKDWDKRNARLIKAGITWEKQIANQKQNDLYLYNRLKKQNDAVQGNR